MLACPFYRRAKTMRATFGDPPPYLLTWQKRFEAKYGPTWHCVVGQEFRAYVSYENKHMIFFPIGNIGKQAVLLFKTK